RAAGEPQPAGRLSRRPRRSTGHDPNGGADDRPDGDAVADARRRSGCGPSGSRAHDVPRAAADLGRQRAGGPQDTAAAPRGLMMCPTRGVALALFWAATGTIAATYVLIPAAILVRGRFVRRPVAA